MKKILGLVFLSLLATSASAADLFASSTQPAVTQSVVVEGTACPGVGATGFSSTGLLLSCQSGVWRDPAPSGNVCGWGMSGNSVPYPTSNSVNCNGRPLTSGCPPGYGIQWMFYSGDGLNYWACSKA